MNKILSFDDAPKEVRKTLIDEINKYSMNQETGIYKSEPEIKANLQQYTGYMLEMLWQARSDKMSVETRDAMDWLTKSLVDEKLQSKYLGCRSRDVSFQGEDHKVLARDVISKTFELFKATPGIELPQEAENFSFRKFFKRK